MPSTRREFLHASAAPLVAAAFTSDAMARLERALAGAAGRSATALAEDEDFWFAVQQGFAIDRSLLNFNNGGTCPSPTVVMEAQKRHLDFSNHAPTRQMWGVLGPQLETVRERLARDLGCSPDELALTRNATESLEICQLGIDLARGDEIVTTTHDYPSMLSTWRQREMRDGLVLKTVPLAPPMTHDELFARITEKVTPKTKVLHVSHITNLTGQILPIRRLCDFARERGIASIVDGAHAYGQFPFRLLDLGCDYYGTSLHKWILAPIGTGLLYMRRPIIPALWPLFPSQDPRSDDVRKFEAIGTHPYAMTLAVAEALTFHQGIGGERKGARLRALRERWTKRLRGSPNAVLYTSDDPATSAGIGSVGFRANGSRELIDPHQVTEHLWKKHRIIVTPIRVDEVRAIRITPNVYTTHAEVDLLADALVALAERGIPS